MIGNKKIDFYRLNKSNIGVYERIINFRNRILWFFFFSLLLFLEIINVYCDNYYYRYFFLFLSFLLVFFVILNTVEGLKLRFFFLRSFKELNYVVWSGGSYISFLTFLVFFVVFILSIFIHFLGVFILYLIRNLFI